MRSDTIESVHASIESVHASVLRDVFTHPSALLTPM